jgi:hypothetical protein
MNTLKKAESMLYDEVSPSPKPDNIKNPSLALGISKCCENVPEGWKKDKIREERTSLKVS